MFLNLAIESIRELPLSVYQGRASKGRDKELKPREGKGEGDSWPINQSTGLAVRYHGLFCLPGSVVSSPDVDECLCSVMEGNFLSLFQCI